MREAEFNFGSCKT